MDLFKLLFSFNGRVGRLSYAGLLLGTILVPLVATIVTTTVMGLPTPRTPAEYQATTEALRGVLWPLNLVIMWVSLANGAKRLHDLGRSGWLQGAILLAVFVALFILGLAAGLHSTAGIAVGGLLSLVVGLYSLWIGVQMLFFPGDEGSNDYGPSPGSGNQGPRVAPPQTRLVPAGERQRLGAAPAQARFVPAGGAQRLGAAPAQAGFGRRR